jgi:predicted RNA binding protein YcfA (HicA-like mRNA interferase family)
MSPSMPTVRGKDAVRTLLRAGFVLNRIVGSHHVLVHPDDSRRVVTVPVHGAKDLKRGTFRSMLRQAGMTVEEFQKFL